jgi:hypothetical protein
MRKHAALFALLIACAACSLFGCGSLNPTPATTTTTTTLPKTWQIVGSAGFTGSANVNEAAIATDDSGQPFVAFSDGTTNPLPSVMEFTGGTWETAGTRGFNGLVSGSGNVYNAGSLSLAVFNNVPYVAFHAASQIQAASFSGTAWNSIGFPSLADDNYPALFANNSGVYCAYQSNTTTQANLKKLVSNTTTWGPFGTLNFSAGDARYLSLFVDGSTPYLAYSDFARGQRLTVAKYNSAADNFTFLGSEGGASTGTVSWPALAVTGGTPYVAFLDSGEVVVQQFNGSVWNRLGGTVSSGQAGFPSLYIYNGIPYVAFADASASNEATVMKLNGASWEAVGPAGFSADPMILSSAETVSLTVSPGGVPFVAIRGQSNGTSRLTVYKYN